VKELMFVVRSRKTANIMLRNRQIKTLVLFLDYFWFIFFIMKIYDLFIL
jgi:hypothetical protein